MLKLSNVYCKKMPRFMILVVKCIDENVYIFCLDLCKYDFKIS